jgi:cation diffusion facilitator CzcD-associated flavoprotein CzcO
MNGTPTTAIIGAGLSGMCMAIKLKEAGFHNFKLYEKADNVGGTWRDNSYPGVACDVPSHLYSYSFEPKLDWSKVYSPGAEIQGYCEHVARKYGLLDHVVFGAELVKSTYKSGSWDLEFANGNQVQAQHLVSCIGGLHVPSFPEIEGRDGFEGASFHSAKWDHSVNLKGKRVAVVGSAASALQLIPEIVDDVKSLDIYQRTPNWVMPRPVESYSAAAIARFKRFPILAKLHRLMIYLTFEGRFPLFRGSRFFGERAKNMALKHLEKQVSDPELRAKLTPDFPVGCKRILASDSFYPALQQDHVDVITEGIASIDNTGIIAENGKRRDVDVIIYATGFKPFTMLDGQEITGIAGRTMKEYLKDGIRAHRTVMVPGFPNYYMLMGPNSGLGHNSIILIIEAQVKYILQCLRETQKRGAIAIDAKEDVSEAFNADIQEQLKDTVWHGQCKSWYQDEKGRIFTLWPRGTVHFRRALARLKPAEFNFLK